MLFQFTNGGFEAHPETFPRSVVIEAEGVRTIGLDTNVALRPIEGMLLRTIDATLHVDLINLIFESRRSVPDDSEYIERHIYRWVIREHLLDGDGILTLRCAVWRSNFYAEVEAEFSFIPSETAGSGSPLTYEVLVRHSFVHEGEVHVSDTAVPVLYPLPDFLPGVWNISDSVQDAVTLERQRVQLRELAMSLGPTPGMATGRGQSRFERPDPLEGGE